MTNIIQISNLQKSFNNIVVLENINLKFLAGESITIIGGSGCGKSVLIQCIAGLHSADFSSSIIIKNVECAQLLVSMRPKNIKEVIGMLFQSNALFDSLTIAENITFGLYNKLTKNGYISRKQTIELNQIARKYLDMVELSSNNLNKYPHELSGGMQKRVAIARVISTKPEVVLLDEPTTGLDPVTSHNISQLLVDIQKTTHATMITITHDPICVSKIAKKIVLIDKKTVAWTGDINEINKIQNPYLEAFKN